MKDIIIVIAFIVIAFVAFKVGQSTKNKVIDQVSLEMQEVKDANQALGQYSDSLYAELTVIHGKVDSLLIAVDVFKIETTELLESASYNSRRAKDKISAYIEQARELDRKRLELQSLAKEFDQ